MSALNNSLLLGAAADGYQISRSLRFNRADSASLSRTVGTASNRTTWTFSCWVKRTAFGENGQTLFTGGTDASNSTRLAFDTSNRLVVENEVAGVTTQFRVTAAVYRDPGAWMHVALAADTTLATAADRVKLWVNGRQVTTFATNNAPTQNLQLQVNAANAHYIGQSFTPAYANFYLAEVNFVDGQSLAASSFGEFDATTGAWNPKAYTGTYGTNGFQLTFADNSSTTATTLGKDAAGSNNWTPNNFAVTGFAPRVYATEATATASSGTIPNGGTPYWIDILPATADLHYSGSTFPVHDGSLATGVYWTGDEYLAGNVMQARFDLRDFTTVTSVRIYCEGITGYVDYSARLLDASKTVIAGTTVAFTGSGASWRTVPVSGSPRYIEFFTTSGTARRLYLYAIEVNGVVLDNVDTRSGIDSLVDSPTNYGNDTGAGGEVRGNYCTLNPVVGGANSTQITFANGNLEATWSTVGGYAVALGTIGVSSGKWYWETIFASGGTALFGIATASSSLANYIGSEASSYGYYSLTGDTYNNSAASVYGSTYAIGDVIGIALDLDNGKIYFSKNGTWQNSGSPTGGTGAAYSGLTGTFFPAYADANTSAASSYAANFGQRPFAYTAPSGYKALCSTNLPTPTILNGATAMDVVTYTGTGATLTPTSSLGFSPDLVWIKNRSNTADHALYDTVRGAQARLESNTTDAEVATDGGLTAFNSNGFTLGTLGQVNLSTNSFAAWCWDAGSSTVTNTAGTISSQVRANPSAGFSIATYTGTGSTGTVGHGLGAVPALMIHKARSSSLQDGWYVYPDALTYLKLETTAATSSGLIWNGVAPTSQVFTARGGDSLNINNTSTYLAYCWTPVAGYSSFGKYTGNGNADGPFVYTGFRPRWVMVKRTDTLASWYIMDSQRLGYNGANRGLYPDLPGAEDSSNFVDILSNGFKPVSNNAAFNASSGTYLYAAFAENPFSISRAR